MGGEYCGDVYADNDPYQWLDCQTHFSACVKSQRHQNDKAVCHVVWVCKSADPRGSVSFNEIAADIVSQCAQRRYGASGNQGCGRDPEPFFRFDAIQDEEIDDDDLQEVERCVECKTRPESAHA